MKLPTKNIIEQRLKMQSTIKSLDGFDVKVEKISDISTVKFAKKWAEWSEEKRTEFARTIGGNPWHTARYIEANLPQPAETI